MINVLGIGLDYLWTEEPNIRGNYLSRLLSYSKSLKTLTRIVYCPSISKVAKSKVLSNVEVIYSHSQSKLSFPFDAIVIARKIVLKHKIDVITAEDPFMGGLTGVILKKIFKIPLNIQIDHDRINNKFWLRERRVNFLKNLLAQLVIRQADTIRVMSWETKEKLCRLGIRKDKFWVIPVYVDCLNFSCRVNNSLRAEYTKRGFDKIIIFIGRLSPEKDVPTLLKAFQRVVIKYSHALLLIVGDGKEKENLLILVKHLKLSDNVCFTGAVSYELIPDYLGLSDIFVLSSLHEGRANVLIEAAFSKKPIITTNVSGVRNIVIDNKTGFIVDQKDYNKMAEKILFLLDNPDTLKSFGEAGNSLVKENIKNINSPERLIQCWEETAKIKIM